MGKTEKVHFVCCYCALLYENASDFNPYKILEVKVSTSFSILGQSHLPVVCQQKDFFFETTGPISFRFLMQSSGKGGGVFSM